jgi:hypothetical protein
MPNSERGGSSEQHAKAGEQSQKNSSGSGSKESGVSGRQSAIFERRPFGPHVSSFSLGAMSAASH